MSVQNLTIKVVIYQQRPVDSGLVYAQALGLYKFRGRCGRMAVRFTTTCAICAYHH
jgi:hypothetical protein